MTYSEMNKREAEYMSKNGYGICYDLDTIEGMTITQKMVQTEKRTDGSWRHWDDEATEAEIQRVRKHHRFEL